MAYTTETLVTDQLGVSYDSSADLQTADVTEFIAQADAIIDDAASEHYWPFNATDSSKTDGTDTYIVPRLIRMCSTKLALVLAIPHLSAQASSSILIERLERAEAMAQSVLDGLRLGKITMKPEKYRDETLTFGDGSQSWELNTDEAFMASTSPLDSGDPPYIFKDSVAISSASTVDSGAGFTASELADKQRSVGYKVEWRKRYGRWVFTDLSGDLSDTSKVTTLKVTYHWDYKRMFADQQHYSGVILGG